MSGVYLYCIGRDDQPAPDAVAGLDDAPVRLVRVAGFGVWVSPLDALPAPTIDRIRRHNDVVERANESVTPLPLRFGQWFADESSLEASLDGRADALRRALGRVRGRVEYGIRILETGAPGAEPGLERGAERGAERDRSSGRAYLEGLARREREAEDSRRRATELAAEIRAWLGPAIREQRVLPSRAGGLAALAHLVDRHDTGSYRARARELPDRHPALRFVFSGPWPPYGFVEEGEAS